MENTTIFYYNTKWHEALYGIIWTIGTIYIIRYIATLIDKRKNFTDQIDKSEVSL
jgi:hypothetical protein